MYQLLIVTHFGKMIATGPDFPPCFQSCIKPKLIAGFIQNMTYIHETPYVVMTARFEKINRVATFSVIPTSPALCPLSYNSKLLPVR